MVGPELRVIINVLPLLTTLPSGGGGHSVTVNGAMASPTQWASRFNTTGRLFARLKKGRGVEEGLLSASFTWLTHVCTLLIKLAQGVL
jgi:hypothetical protein